MLAVKLEAGAELLHAAATDLLGSSPSLLACLQGAADEQEVNEQMQAMRPLQLLLAHV
jgi:hypothetical protein